MSKKLYYITVQLVLWQSIILGFNNSYAEDAILVETTKVIAQQIQRNYKTIASIQNINSKNYFAKVSGVVDIKLTNTDNIVRKNDIILAINHDMAETIKAKAELNYKLAKNKLAKDATLYMQKIINERALNLAQIELEEAKLELETANNNYNNHILRAPFDGRIGLIKFNLNDNIKIDDFLFTIVSPGYKQATIYLPQKLYSQITKQNKITLINDNGGKHKAMINLISPYINQDTGSFTIQIEFDDNDNYFLHGSYADVDIAYGQHKAVIIPGLALLIDGKGYYVYQTNTQINNDTADITVTKKYITLGNKIANLVEVQTGLQVDDEIVVEGVNKLHEGAKIKIKSSSNIQN